MSWRSLFSLCSAGGLNAVCITACTSDKVSDRELRCAVYVQTTQVTRYSSRLETRERGVFQMDTVPAIAGYCRIIPKTCYGTGEHCHAITDAPTDCTAVESQRGRDRENANSVVKKAGIESYEVRAVDHDSLSRVALEDVI